MIVQIKIVVLIEDYRIFKSFLFLTAVWKKTVHMIYVALTNLVVECVIIVDSDIIDTLFS